jgi:hypothetical protein
MYRRFLALSALFCSVSVAESPTTTVTVVLAGERAPLSVVRAMQRETAAALASSAIDLNWMGSENMPDSGLEGEVAIVRLRGECRPAPPAPHTEPGSGKTVLGQTHIVKGQVLPFTDVLCDTVRQLLARDLRAERRSDRDTLLGRALGRVAAHELYHILLRTTEHARSGLSRAEQSSAELLADHESFETKDEQRIADSVSGR